MAPLPGWVRFHSHTNYRSRRQIFDMLALIGEAHQLVETASPFKGADIEVGVSGEGIWN